MAGLADQARAFAAMTMVPPNAAVRTINLQAHFMLGGRAHPLRIEARVAATTDRLLRLPWEAVGT